MPRRTVALALGFLLTAPALVEQPLVAQESDADDPVQVLVSRLTLEDYKTTLKGLTQFGDRRQGTQRNRDAVDWIEAQLQSYGCETGRIDYVYESAPPRALGARRPPRRPAGS